MPFEKSLPPPLPPYPAVFVVSGVTPRAQLLSGEGRINKSQTSSQNATSPFICAKVSLSYLFLLRTDSGIEGLRLHIVSGNKEFVLDAWQQASPLVTPVAGNLFTLDSGRPDF